VDIATWLKLLQCWSIKTHWPCLHNFTVRLFVCGDAHCWMKIKNKQLKKRFLQQTNDGLTSKCTARFVCMAPLRVGVVGHLERNHPCCLPSKKTNLLWTWLQFRSSKKPHCECARSFHFCGVGQLPLDVWLHGSAILCKLLQLFLWLLIALRLETRGLAALCNQWPVNTPAISCNVFVPFSCGGLDGSWSFAHCVFVHK